MVDGKNFRLADEVRYILRRAAEHDGRVVTIGQLVLFSTETGDAWLLDPSDQLAARLARDGDPEPFHIEENETTFTIHWKGRYRIEGAAFVYQGCLPLRLRAADRKASEPCSTRDCCFVQQRRRPCEPIAVSSLLLCRAGRRQNCGENRLKPVPCPKKGSLTTLYAVPG
jgi:hypothetical protein